MMTYTEMAIGLGLAGFLGLALPGPGSRDMPRITHIGETRVVSLLHLTQFYQLPRPRPEENRVEIKRGEDRWIFELQSRRAFLNGIQIWLHQPVLVHRRHWVLSEKDVLTIVDPLMRPGRYAAQAGHQRVMLDAGHGGRDPGAIGALGTEEKSLALTIAQKVADRLQREQIDVLMSREDDVFLTLSERVERAVARRADLFVSIHFNTSSNPEAKGSETFVLTAGGMPSTYDTGSAFPGELPGNRFDALNSLAGFAVQQRLIERSRNEDRGLRRARFHVLREASCPALLVECAFLSNRSEERQLHKEAYLDAIAEGIAIGIMDYLSLAKRSALMYNSSHE